MYAAVLVACLVAVAQALPHSVQMFEIAPAKKAPVKLRYDPYEETWAAFKQKHGKTYSTGEEEIDRMKIFLDNVKLIELHNWEYFNLKKSYYMDINQFTDMTFEEYKKYNRLQARDSSRNTTIQCTQFQPPLNWHTPADVDWRKEGYVTPVKNQGQCGSCWSFSTTGSMEGQHYRLSKVLDSLSEQQLVDCSGKFGNQGCDGGLMDQAFEYINSVGGLESESKYPYEAVQQKCSFKKKEIVTETYVKGCQDIQSGSESDLMQAVASQGPISVAIDAGHPSFQSYSGGVYDEPACSSSELDHGVLVVGYGSSNGQEYWLVKNSWGTSWGDEGYILMARNKDNQCGIATAASFPQLSSS